jgi:outer membrane protein TolC
MARRTRRFQLLLVALCASGLVAGNARSQSPLLPGPGGMLTPPGPGVLTPPTGWRLPLAPVYSPSSAPAVKATLPSNKPATPLANLALDQMPPAILGPPVESAAGGGGRHLTLDEAKQRVLANSKLMALAAANIRGKEFATRAMRADYFPQVIGGLVYFHFSDDLGDALTLGGKRIKGPLGGGIGLPTTSADVPIFFRNSEYGTVTMVQPITALLKVRQGVKISLADEEIARADLEKAGRALTIGTEQLYLGLVAAGKLRAGTQIALDGAEMMAKVQPTVQVRIAVLEAKQGLQALDKQIAELREQLDILADLPGCEKLELAEPPLPVPSVTCCDEAVSLALAASPELRAAEQDIAKAHAAVAAAKVDYLPNVLVFGGYINNNGMAVVTQQNIGYVGASVSYTFLDWGKRHAIVRERDNLVYMATLKVQQTSDEVRQKALKAFREYQENQATLKLAAEMAQLRKEAEKAATTPPAQYQAAKDRMTAEVDLVKADLALRVSAAQLLNLIGRHQ